jgi:hypothetical protein
LPGFFGVGLGDGETVVVEQVAVNDHVRSATVVEVLFSE